MSCTLYFFYSDEQKIIFSIIQSAIGFLTAVNCKSPIILNLAIFKINL